MSKRDSLMRHAVTVHEPVSKLPCVLIGLSYAVMIGLILLLFSIAG